MTPLLIDIKPKINLSNLTGIMLFRSETISTSSFSTFSCLVSSEWSIELDLRNNQSPNNFNFPLLEPINYTPWPPLQVKSV